MAVCLFLNCSKLAQVTDSKLSDNNNCGKRPILEPLSLIIDNKKKKNTWSGIQVGPGNQNIGSSHSVNFKRKEVKSLKDTCILDPPKRTINAP